MREEKDGGAMEEAKGKETAKEKRITDGDTRFPLGKGLFQDWSPSTSSFGRHSFCTRVLLIQKFSTRSDLTKYKLAQAANDMTRYAANSAAF